MTRNENKPSIAAVKELMGANHDVLREIVQDLLQEMLEGEMSEALGASKSEGSDDRVGYRSGHYNRTLITRVGKLELRVPQDRDGRFSRSSCSSATSDRSNRWLRRWPRCTFRAFPTAR